jgi:hypothetical protein
MLKDGGERYSSQFLLPYIKVAGSRRQRALGGGEWVVDAQEEREEKRRKGEKRGWGRAVDVPYSTVLDVMW